MSSENTSENERARSRRDLLALGAGAALSALLLLLSFPPAGIDWLAWCALAPLLLVIHRLRERRGLLVLWAAGLVFGTAGFFWVRHVTWLGMLLLGFYVSIYFVLFGWSVRWLSVRRGVPMALAAPVAWAGLEYIRGVFLGGLPWLFLAHTQYRAVAVIQIADLAGAPGVSFWLAAVAGAIADGVGCVWPRPRGLPGARPGRVLAAALFVLAFSIAAQFYGVHRLGTLAVKSGPRLAAIQGNIPQEVKNLTGMKDPEEQQRQIAAIFEKHLDLTDRAESEPPPRMVIWPETMAPSYPFVIWLETKIPPHLFGHWGLYDRNFLALAPKLLDQLAIEGRREEGAELLAELDTRANWRRRLDKAQKLADLLLTSVHASGDEKAPAYYNSVYQFPRGGAGPDARYDKIHLVPFGEYVPLKPLIGWLVGPLVPYRTGLSAGEGPKLFELDGWHFAPTVCFEDAFASLVADFARRGPKMDFIVNVTNEGWFKDGAELDEHLAIAVFRAVECRAGFVRAANTGISAFIAPTGRILATLSVGGRDREVAGVLEGFATAAEGRSPYLAVGEAFGLACAALWLFCMAIPVCAGIRQWRRRRRR